MTMKRIALFALFCAVATTATAQQTASANLVRSQEASQQQQQPIPEARQVPVNSLQAHLNSIQLQAQRHMGQLNSLMLNAAANLTNSPAGQQATLASGKFSPVLEALTNVGKVIQQQIGASPNNVHLVTGGEDSANNRKNEYQAFESSANSNSAPNLAQQGQTSAPNYREQGEVLRQEIVKRAGQLQQVVSSSMELVKNNGDLIVRRLLDQMNIRLDQAKAKADRILNEPATNEVAVKALSTINLGLNNLNIIITNIVTRLDQAAKEHQINSQLVSNSAGLQQRRSQSSELPLGLFRVNLQQLSQQFQSALNATGSSNQHQLGPFMRQRQQQIQQALAAADQLQQKQEGAKLGEQLIGSTNNKIGQPQQQRDANTSQQQQQQKVAN